MSDPTDPRQEYPSTYFVQDRSSQDEMSRLRIQDQMMTASMGGTLPEQPDPTIFQRILDVGCGTGGWLIEVAKAYPDIKLLVGIDASREMIEYAREQAIKQGVSDRIEFHIMDALLILEFPAKYFDLVNQRFAGSWLRTWEWPKLLAEYQRVARPGGMIRITEADLTTITNSQALEKMGYLLFQTFYRSGHLFIEDPKGMISDIERLFHQFGYENVQKRFHTSIYKAGTLEGNYFYEDIKHLYRTALPFFRKWNHVPEDYESTYQQMLTEVQQPDFVTQWRVLTVWGNNPTYPAS